MVTTRIRWFALPVVALPLYSVATSLEACSGSLGTAPNVETTGSAITCGDGEDAKAIGHGNLCCTRGTGAGPIACRDPNVAIPGAPCAAVGATRPGAAYSLTMDTCVAETCAGDRTCSEFPLLAEKTSGTLHCVARGGATFWEWASAPSRHVARRACVSVGYRACGTGAVYPAYSPYSPYTLEPPSFVPVTEACGTEPVGYYGQFRYINVRDLFLVESSCTIGSGPKATCPIDEL